MINLKNFVLGIAIFILTMFVGIYGISTVFDSRPDYEDYCPNILTEEQCTENNGTWVANQEIINGGVKAVPGGYCQYDYNLCQEKWQDAREDYQRKVFLAALPLGIIIIIAGALIFGLETVGAGLMAGGVGLIIYGVGGYWEFTEDWLKFVFSLAGLIVVIWLAYYANKRWNASNTVRVKRKR